MLYPTSCRGTQCLGGGLVDVGQFLDEFAFVHHEQAVGGGNGLFHICSDDKHRHPVVCNLTEEFVDLEPGTYIDPARRFLQHQYLGMTSEATGKQDLLLVAA
jgi:hypothetical protein